MEQKKVLKNKSFFIVFSFDDLIFDIKMFYSTTERYLIKILSTIECAIEWAIEWLL